MKIIDVHSHIFDRRYFEALAEDFAFDRSVTAEGQFLMRRDGYTYTWYREEFFDIESELRRMDDQGVDMRLLSLSTPNVYDWHGDRQLAITRLMNDVLAEVVRKYPDRFGGLGSLPLGNVEASLVELDRIIGPLKLHGATIGSNVDGVQLNDRRFEPLWARLNELRLPVFEHPMFPPGTRNEEFELPLRVGFAFDTTTAATRMIYSGIFERYPNFPFILAHTGGALLPLLQRLDNGYRLFPDCRKYITRPPSEYAKQLYYDTASFYEPTILMAQQIVGADKLLWGSDAPMIGADASLIKHLPLSADDKTKILGGNAAKLFKIKL